MKYLRGIGLAALVALALAAFAGAGTASAAVLCKTVPNKSGVCEGGKYPSDTTFETTSLNAKLTVNGSGVITSITCTHSVIRVTITAESGTPGVPGQVTGISFSSCTTNSGSACTVSETKGYTGSLAPTTDTGNGTLSVSGTAETEVVCGALFTCKYKPTASGLSLSFTGGNPGSDEAKEQELALVSGFGFGCGTGAKLDGTWKGTGTNSGVWIATS